MNKLKTYIDVILPAINESFPHAEVIPGGQRHVT